MPNSIFVAFDGDGIGSRVGKAVLADDVPGIRDISAKIQHGQDVIAAWAQSYNGVQLSFGGDEASYQLPAEALESLEQVRKDYEFATGGMTCTAGVGSRLSEAGKSLIVGKLRGKNNICSYDESVEQEYAQAEADTEAGTATGEAAKLGHAYLKKDPQMPQPDQSGNPEIDDHSDCPYCQELQASQDSDPDHCGSCHDEGDDCPYCQEYDQAHDPTAEGHTDDCPYCAEAAAHDPTADDHTDDCPYCAEAAAEEVSEVAPALEEPAIIPEAANPIMDDPNEHSEQGMDAIVADIVAENDESNTIQPSNSADVDVSDEPVGINMEGSVSRPDGYAENTPGDAGIPGGEVLNDSMQPQEDDGAPDMGTVLQDSLEDHADSIQKERVMNMVRDALLNFKNNKAALEQARGQDPGLYQSSIAMIKAMIEMAKMLGLDEKAPVPPQGGMPAPQGGQASAPPAQGAPEENPSNPKMVGQ